MGLKFGLAQSTHLKYLKGFLYPELNNSVKYAATPVQLTRVSSPQKGLSDTELFESVPRSEFANSYVAIV